MDLDDDHHERHPLAGAGAAALAGQSADDRDADNELARALRRPPAARASVSAGYLNELHGRPALPQQLERELIRASQGGDARARARLVEAFLPLIASTARIYRATRHVQRIELLQEGVVGLLRALERYDPDRGVPFWAYASWWVRQAMQQLVAELTRPVVLSDRALRGLARIREADQQAHASTGRPASRRQLAEATELGEEQIDQLLGADRSARSLDEPLREDDQGLTTFGDLLIDPLAGDAYEHVLNAIEVDELHALLSGLSERERDVLRARYGLDGEECSLRQIGERLGMSAERVRQIEQRALGKLGAAAGAV